MDAVTLATRRMRIYPNVFSTYAGESHWGIPTGGAVQYVPSYSYGFISESRIMDGYVLREIWQPDGWIRYSTDKGLNR